MDACASVDPGAAGWPRVRGDSYNRLERGLHRLALEPRVVREIAFELECLWSRPRVAPDAGRPVYVCGLARSGTTVLLRALAAVDEFRSLTYRDMPFVLAPNLWRKLARVRQHSIPPVERAHGDGIMVDFDSPEAFEEVFWRTFCPQPPGARGYGEVQPDAETMAAFAKYRAVVAGPKRYLSKNNNNVVRLHALAAEPTARCFVVYRDPARCALSLFEQHRRFAAIQASDSFTRAYMRWLGHHEFGLDHKPFSFALPEMDASLSTDDPNYWLDYWTAIHRHISCVLPQAAYLVDHDRLRAEPGVMLHAVAAAAGIEVDDAVLSREISPATAGRDLPSKLDAARLDLAYAAHEALVRSERNVHR